MPTHDTLQETTFYEELQKKKAWIYGMSVASVIIQLWYCCVILALLRYRDGTLSSIHRSMENNQVKLCAVLGVDNQKVVSRTHLPRLLGKVNRAAFEQLLSRYAKIELEEGAKKWFAGDGKELRGSIEKEDNRGEVSVQIVSHEDRAVIGQAFYNGTKESEKPCLQQLMEHTEVHSQQITADALHLHPSMTESVHGASGIFVIGLKGNQKELLQDMKDHTEAFKPKMEHRTVDKGHGRLEIREYSCFDISEEYFESRWDKYGFRSLLQVERTCIVLKTNESSKETSYYISNGKAGNALEYFGAIRNHSSIEVNNHYRDVSLKEGVAPI